MKSTTKTYHQSSSVKAVLVLLALKVLASQPQNLTVVPPQETKHDNVHHPGDCNESPMDLAPDVDRSDLVEPGITVEHDSLAVVDGYKDAAA